MLQGKDHVLASQLHEMNLGDKACMLHKNEHPSVIHKKCKNKSMPATSIPASNSEVEAVENDQGVHAFASPARPRAVQSWRHQFEEHSHRMNGMQGTQNLQQHTVESGTSDMKCTQLSCSDIVHWCQSREGSSIKESIKGVKLQ